MGIVNGTRFREGNAEWYHFNGELTRLAEKGDVFTSTQMKARLRDFLLRELREGR